MSDETGHIPPHVMRPDWRPYDPDLPFGQRPMRQLVCLKGSAHHSGVLWDRWYIGIAWIEKDGPQGYSQADIDGLMKQGGMETAQVVAWAPAAFMWPAHDVIGGKDQ